MTNRGAPSPLIIAKATAAMAIIPNNDTVPLAQRERINGAYVARQLSELERIQLVMISLNAAISGADEGLEIARPWWRDYQSRDADIRNQFDLEEAWEAWREDPPLHVNVNQLFEIAEYVRPGWQREWHREYVGWRLGPVEPVDLWGRFDPPTLPRGQLPEVIEKFAFEQGDLMGADPAGLAVGALAVCAAAISDLVRIRVKKHDAWTESARIWVAVIGDPSSKKSPIIYRVVKPASEIDAKMWGEYLSARERYDARSEGPSRSRNRSG
jgi:uncharacterized protein DUF3987